MISDIVEGNEVEGGQKRFSDCSNIAPLYGPLEVVRALYDLRQAVRVTATDIERAQGDRLPTVLVDEIRRDLQFRRTLA